MSAIDQWIVNEFALDEIGSSQIWTIAENTFKLSFGLGAQTSDYLGRNCVKIHEIVGPEIFHEIFMKYFKKIHDVFPAFTLTRLTFFIRQTLSFIHLCILQLPKPIWRPTCLVCLFKYG